MLSLLRAARPELGRWLPAAAAALPVAVPAPAATAASGHAACWQRSSSSSANSAAPAGGQAAAGVHHSSHPSAAASSSSASCGGPADTSASQWHQHQEHTGYGYFQEQDEDDEQQRQQRAADNAAFEAERQRLLAAALRHIPKLGWSGGAAAAAAATELGLSPAAAGVLGSDAQVVQLFFADCNRRLEEQLAGMQAELAELGVRGRLLAGLRLRLSMLEPFMARWPQALSLLAQPAAVPRTLALYAELADAIWHAAGDTSTDLSWYSKRALLAGVYSSAELYMLTDCSPGYADTWAALGRQLDGALELGDATKGAASLKGAMGSAAGAALSMLGSLLRPPAP